jgi:uncharacterized membrane protein YdbT with pleckstrin-like domain
MMASYIDKVLIAGERVVYQARLSLWPFAGWILLGVVTLPLVVGIFILLWVWTRFASTELAITNKRIIAKFGFINRSTVELNLSRVESLQVHQGLLGRIFDFGSILVSGAGNPQAPIPGIADPLEFRKRFMEATDATQSMRASA